MFTFTDIPSLCVFTTALRDAGYRFTVRGPVTSYWLWIVYVHSNQ